MFHIDQERLSDNQAAGIYDGDLSDDWCVKCDRVMLRLFSSARDTTVAFILASVGTLVGTAVAWLLLSQRLGPGGWQVWPIPMCNDSFSPLLIHFKEYCFI